MNTTTSTNSGTRTVAVGLFREPERARDAISALKDAGFRGEDIGLLMHDTGDARRMAEETGTRAGEGAGTGLVAGGILGGIGGWLVGIGALAIPGVGPFIAAGALGTALAGAAVGAGVGAIAGALIGMGIPKDEADYYEKEVRGGRTLVTVKAGSRMAEADAILHQHGASDVEHRDGAAMGMGATAGTAAGAATVASTGATDKRTVRLHEEELAARKTPVQTGEVTVRKEVKTEQEHLEVPVAREEVVVERRPVERTPADRPMRDTGQGQEIRVPVREEQVTVEKRPVVTEEVTVGKRAVQDTQPVSANLRREEAVIERKGDVDVSGDADEPPTARPGV